MTNFYCMYDSTDFPCDNRSLFSDPSKHTKDADGKWESKYEWKVFFITNNIFLNVFVAFSNRVFFCAQSA